MMLLALGANIGGRRARGFVTAAAEDVGDGAGELASRSLPISDASATDPRPIWQRRRKCRRVTSPAYFWGGVIARPKPLVALPARCHNPLLRPGSRVNRQFDTPVHAPASARGTP